MSKHIGPVCKLCRREGEKLYLKGERCFTPKCAFEKRPFAPGQHGRTGSRGGGRGGGSRTGESDYLHQLRAKQRAASEKMKQMEKAGGEALDQVRETADKIWADLKVGIADAHSKFK